MQIENRQRLLTVLAIAAVALFAGDRLLLTPIKNLWNARSERLAKLRVQIAQGKSLIQREQIIRSNWETIRRNSLPNNQTATEQQVFKSVNQWAQESGTTLTGMSPVWKHDADDYMTLECRVDAKGSISTLSKFLYDVENDPMALRLQSVELSARDKEGKVLALGLQFSSLVLTPQGHAER